MVPKLIGSLYDPFKKEAESFIKLFIPLIPLRTQRREKCRVLTLASLWVEMKCPEHGLERFKIKIIRKFNIKSEAIIPRYRRRPIVGDLSCLMVGRNVSRKEIENYLADYFRRKGIMEMILRMRLVG